MGTIDGFGGETCTRCRQGEYEQVADNTWQCDNCGKKVGERSIDVS